MNATQYKNCELNCAVSLVFASVRTNIEQNYKFIINRGPIPRSSTFQSGKWVNFNILQKRNNKFV